MLQHRMLRGMPRPFVVGVTRGDVVLGTPSRSRAVEPTSVYLRVHKVNIRGHVETEITLTDGPFSLAECPLKGESAA